MCPGGICGNSIGGNATVINNGPPPYTLTADDRTQIAAIPAGVPVMIIRLAHSSNATALAQNIREELTSRGHDVSDSDANNISSAGAIEVHPMPQNPNAWVVVVNPATAGG
jgi:hypothetical protein